MNLFHAKSSILWVGIPATLALAGSLLSRGSGVQSGTNSIPANASRQTPSCNACHSGSAPSSTRSNAPTTTLTAAKRALNASETIAVTTAVSGGPSGTTGGFMCETTAGSFTAGANSKIISNTNSVTHRDNGSRSWAYSFNAPAAAGPVLLTSVGLATNGSGSSGDQFSFSGYDRNATVATPVRLYVLPAGVVANGTACADGYGNQSVLGATSSPTRGNAAFAWELIGATPNDLAIMMFAFNPVGFTYVDLGPLYGLTGCRGYVVNPSTAVGITSTGNTVRAEGTITWPLPIPNQPQLLGLTLNVQAAYHDPTAESMLGRSMPFSFSNGLTATVR